MGEKVVVNEKKSGKISGCWAVEKGEHFWQKVLQKCTDAKRQKKGGLERFSKKMNAKYFLSGNCFGTPLCTTCKNGHG
jgi:hypothetical protein